MGSWLAQLTHGPMPKPNRKGSVDKLGKTKPGGRRLLYPVTLEVTSLQGESKKPEPSPLGRRPIALRVGGPWPLGWRPCRLSPSLAASLPHVASKAPGASTHSGRLLDEDRVLGGRGTRVRLAVQSVKRFGSQPAKASKSPKVRRSADQLSIL